MRCPKCHLDDDKVLETRVLASGTIIRRRRLCNGCDNRFTSYEKVEEQSLKIIKRNNKREEFDRSKLEHGIKTAVRKRPISSNQIKHILDEVEEEAWNHAGTSREIKSIYLGELVLARLLAVDQVAYLRFASVYRNFETFEEFSKEILALNQEDTQSH